MCVDCGPGLSGLNSLKVSRLGLTVLLWDLHQAGKEGLGMVLQAETWALGLPPWSAAGLRARLAALPTRRPKKGWDEQ